MDPSGTPAAIAARGEVGRVYASRSRGARRYLCQPRPQYTAAVRHPLPRMLAFVLLAAVGLPTWCEAQAAGPGSLPTLTTIKSIRALSQDEAARGYPVRVRAIVSHFDEQWDTGLILHDGEFGQYVNTPTHPERVGEWKNL